MTGVTAPAGWKLSAFADVLDMLLDHRGKTPGKLGGEFTDSGVPVVSAIHVKAGRLDLDQRRRFVSTEMALRWMPERLRRGDVLMTSEAPLGSVARVPNDNLLVLSQRLFALRGRAQVLDNGFLFWAMQSPQIQDQLRSRSSGSTVTGIRQSELRRVQIGFPPVCEQRRIVEILEDHLSRLDAGADMLTNVARRGRALEFAALDALVPAGSPSVMMKDLARDARYGTSTKCLAEGPGLPVARIPNIIGGAIDMTDEKRAADPSVDLSGLMLEEGDVVFVRTNGSRDLIGRTAVVQRGVRASFASYLIRYQLDRAVVDPTWCHLMMNRASARAEIERLASSSAGQYNLSLGKIGGLPVPLPELSVQHKLIEQYEASLDGPRRLVSAAVHAQRRSVALRRALLTAAFTGTLTGTTTDMEQVEEMAGV
ncbi:restriction endonuclease subunit S [Isoptericola sp. NPDC019693]|uniref:restriction endonuclease subunit S n=1 Tax=Isoptericola sp. NPDC019693 TaxID=3364009 RepID=UPI0037913DF8